jgi:hypothetical protein
MRTPHVIAAYSVSPKPRILRVGRTPIVRKYIAYCSIGNTYYVLSPRLIYTLEKVDNWKLECMHEMEDASDNGPSDPTVVILCATSIM